MNWYDYQITWPYNPSVGEYGVDLGTPFHTPLISPISGVVVEAGDTVWPDNSSSGGVVVVEGNVPGYGEHDLYFLHVDALAPGIVPGAIVQAGQVVAYSGGQNSGGQWPASPEWSTGPHTEFGFDAPFLVHHFQNVDPTSFIESLRSGTISTDMSNFPLGSYYGGPNPPFPVPNPNNSIINTIQQTLLKSFILIIALVLIAFGLWIFSHE